MILMWFGSLALMIYAVVSTQKAWSEIFIRWQKSILDRSGEFSMKNIFLNSLSSVVLEASPQKSLYTAMALLNLRTVPQRSAVLNMCLSPLGIWLLLVLSALALNFNGFFLLGLGAVGWLSYALIGRFEKALNVIFGAGLFLVGAEAVLKNSRVVQSLLGESDLAFLLADGRFGAVVIILALAGVLGLVMRFEVWAVIVASSLLITGTMSFNGALGLVLGAKLAECGLFWGRTKGLNQVCRQLGQQWALVSALGLIAGFVVSGEVRTALNWSFTTEFSAVQEKSAQFIFCVAVLHLSQWFFLMIWGHRAGNKELEEIQDAKYFSATWVQEDLLGSGGRLWGKEKVQRRLSEIRYHLAGLGSLKEGQVPEPMQQRLRNDEEQLSRVTFL